MKNINIIHILLVILLVCLIYLFLTHKNVEKFADDIQDIKKLTTKGIKGPKGDIGPIGDTGDTGDKGDSGVAGDIATPDLLGFSVIKNGTAVSSITLPKQLCLGDTCLTDSDVGKLKKKWSKCKLMLWDAPLNYRIYSSIWPYTTGTDATNWLNVRNSDLAWTDSRLKSITGWHPSVNNYEGQWMIINTDPMLSQKVKGFRCFPRGDTTPGNNSQYILSLYLMYMPLDGSGEVPCEKGDNRNLGKLYDFNNNAPWSGFEIFFAKEVTCKYIKIIYNTYVGTPANRCGLYICV